MTKSSPLVLELSSSYSSSLIRATGSCCPEEEEKEHVENEEITSIAAATSLATLKETLTPCMNCKDGSLMSKLSVKWLLATCIGSFCMLPAALLLLQQVQGGHQYTQSQSQHGGEVMRQAMDTNTFPLANASKPTLLLSSKNSSKQNVTNHNDWWADEDPIHSRAERSNHATLSKAVQVPIHPSRRLSTRPQQDHESLEEEWKQRWRARRQRTRPPPNPALLQTPFKSGRLALHLDSFGSEAPSKHQTAKADNVNANANMIRNQKRGLCGQHARLAFDNHPSHYPPAAHLDLHSTVLLHGMFSSYAPHNTTLSLVSTLGTKLALSLHKRCHVQRILALDAWYPNDSPHRARLLEEYAAVLRRTIPEFYIVRPTGVVGVQPRFWRVDGGEEEEEWDVVKLYEPTHIVHLGSYHPPTQFPSSSSSSSSSSFATRDMFAMRQGMVAMDQFLHSLALSTTSEMEWPEGVEEEEDLWRREQERKVQLGHAQFVYLSSEVVYRYHEEGGGGGESGGRRRLKAKKKNHKEVDTKNQPLEKRDASFGSSLSDQRQITENQTLPSITTTTMTTTPSLTQTLYRTARLMDETMAATYHQLHNVSSVGLRMGRVYEPRHCFVTREEEDWVRQAVLQQSGSTKKKKEEEDEEVWEVVEKRLRQAVFGTADSNHVPEETAAMEVGRELYDFVFVDDAVNAIVAAMQYRRPTLEDKDASGVGGGGGASVFNVGGKDETRRSLHEVAKFMAEELDARTESIVAKRQVGLDADQKEENDENEQRGRKLDAKPQPQPRAMSLALSEEYLGWTPRTSLQEGVAKVVAYHLNRTAWEVQDIATEKDKNGELAEDVTSGINVTLPTPPLLKEGIDVVHTIPCISECYRPASPHAATAFADAKLGGSMKLRPQCAVSPYDGLVRKLLLRLTEKCSYVLYTVDLNPNLAHALHGSEASSDQGREEKLCKIALVAKESPLVEQLLEKAAVMPQTKEGEEEKQRHRRLLGKKRKGDTSRNLQQEKEEKHKFLPYALMNGRIKHQAWTLVWIQTSGLSEEMRKDAVITAKVTPGSFFASTVRKAMYVSPVKANLPPTRDLLHVVQGATDFPGRGFTKKWVGEAPYRKKLVFQPQPARRAILFIAEPTTEFELHPSELTSINYILSGMDLNKEEPPQLYKQRMFYEDVSHIMQGEEFRTREEIQEGERDDSMRPVYSQWIIHDLELEAARELRCDWYGEYKFWHRSDGKPEFTAEDMSLRYVLARRAAEGRHSKPCDGWISVLDPKRSRGPPPKKKKDEVKNVWDDDYEENTKDYWYLDPYRNIRCRKYGNHETTQGGTELFVRLVEKDVTPTMERRLKDAQVMVAQDYA